MRVQRRLTMVTLLLLCNYVLEEINPPRTIGRVSSYTVFQASIIPTADIVRERDSSQSSPSHSFYSKAADTMVLHDPGLKRSPAVDKTLRLTSSNWFCNADRFLVIFTGI